ncbi:MAG: hypothetical protein ACXWDJ_09685 [Aeromicrobium sp.]
MAAQGIVVMLLELPTGGLADSVGRRVVLPKPSSPTPTSRVQWVLAEPFSERHWRSGQWPAAGLSHWTRSRPSTLSSCPLLVGLVLRGVELVSISHLMVEPLRRRAPRTVRRIPAVVRDSLRMVRGSHVLAALIAVELLWGAGMIAFETFTPLRLEAVLGDADDAASLFGLTNAIAWLASAGAAAAAPSLARRTGAPLAGAAMRLAQGVTVAWIALLAGPAGVIVAYVATMAVHGAANPVHQGMPHRAVPTRTTGQPCCPSIA